MVTKAKIVFLLLATLTFAVRAGAQQVSLRPVYTERQQTLYSVTATVETKVAPDGPKGLTSAVRKELTATVLIKTVGLGEQGEVQQEATIESISIRSNVNGKEQAQDAEKLVGKKIEYTMDRSGHLVKSALPQPADLVVLAELLFGLTPWLPLSDVSVGQTWEASWLRPFYSYELSEISKGIKTTYKLAGLANNIALIEGAIALDQKGTSMLTTTEGAKDVGVIAAGNGTVRFEFDTNLKRVVGGTTETRIEGKLSHIAPTAAGQKMEPRNGALVETSRFSIKMIK
jgi:hypothetical protein